VDRIKKIFFSLSKTEIRYLKHFLTAFHSKGSNKSLELIELLEKKPNLSQAELSERLYGNPQSKAFLMMKKRLLEKMLETLSLSINFHNNPTFKEDPASYQTIALLKDYIYALFLRRRGLENLALELLEKCYLNAEAYSLPEYQLLALASMRSLMGSWKQNRHDFGAEIEMALRKYESDLQAGGAFEHFRDLTAMHPAFDQEKIDFLETETSKLADRLEDFDSVRARFYYLNLKLQLHNGQEDYEMSKEVLEEMIQLIHRHKGLKSRNRLGIPYLRLATIELYQSHFEAGLEAAEEAMRVLQPQKHNFLQAAICKLFACCYLNRLDDADDCIHQLHHFTEVPKERHHYATRLSLDWITYFKSCIAFLRRDFRAAFRLMGDVETIFSDKKGWNIDLRIHEILILIEMQHFDLASARIETLRKHIGKYEVEERVKQIFRFLYQLERHSFDFGRITPEMDQILQRLGGELTWAPFNAEVIRFDTWIKSHSLKTGV
jgi:hypothetical protein